MYTLCRDTGVLARDGRCAAHGGNDCLGGFVEADDEWSELRGQRDRAMQVARLIERDLSKIIGNLIQHNKRWRQGYRNILGEYQPAPLEGDTGEAP